MLFFQQCLKKVRLALSLFKPVLQSCALCCALLASCVLSVAYADDTEIFFSEAGDLTQTNPNILFMLDNSGSMGVVKLANMKTAMNTILDSVSDVNIGLMNFTNPQHGGRLVYPVTDIESPRARGEMKDVVNGMRANTWTPIVRAYYEAAMILRGGPKEFGEFGSVPYSSPMVSECQSSYVVILSDGAATTGKDTTLLKRLIGMPERASCENRDRDETCGVELARWLNKDKRQDPDNLFIDKDITTYTIGFNIRSSFLSDLATEGGGAYFEASTAQELTVVFQDILGAVSEVDSTFVAPATSINQFNRLTLGNDLYFSLFKPQPKTNWIGNLKRYQLGLSGGSIKILDQNKNVAVDEDTGFFKASAQSFWSDSVDGMEVGRGGAVGELPSQPLEGSNRRKVFTFLGDVNQEGPIRLETRNSDYRYEVHVDNKAITEDIVPPLGTSNGGRDNILRWARGYDEKNENDDSNTTGIRAHMGDPLHSSPAVINYPDRSVVFFGTNEGFLHAIDSRDGQELFSFVPKELLGNLPSLYRDEKTLKRTYGLDGPITIWHDDKDPNKDGVVNGDDKVYLYVGMRRGGKHYYAFDVTNPEKPIFIWQIEGGSSDFSQLGQTWSKPTRARVMYNGVLREILVFAGGYDTNQDNDSGIARRADGYGNTLYMIDAVTGKKIWNAQAINKWDDMKYSIPSDIRVLDVDGNGLLDRMYVGDMGGQIWRFDIKQHHLSSDSADDFINGGVMANLGGDGANNSIRFFNQPDIAFINQEGQRFVSISIGSGWRAHPLDRQTQDRFYMIRDNNPLAITGDYGLRDGSSYRAITDSDLINVTDNGGQPLTNIAHGWYLHMEDSGEKVLGKSITINNQVLFTAYTPGVTSNVCEPAIGTSSAYVVKITNGDPVLNSGGVSDPTDSDDTTLFNKENRKTPLNQTGIAPSPSAIITMSDGEILSTILIGTEEIKGIDFSEFTRRTYWLDKKRGPSTPAELNR